MCVSRALTRPPCAPHTSLYMACNLQRNRPSQHPPARGRKIPQLRMRARPAVASMDPAVHREPAKAPSGQACAHPRTHHTPRSRRTRFLHALRHECRAPHAGGVRRCMSGPGQRCQRNNWRQRQVKCEMCWERRASVGSGGFHGGWRSCGRCAQMLPEIMAGPSRAAAIKWPGCGHASRRCAAAGWRGHRAAYHGYKTISRFKGKTEIACKYVHSDTGVPQMGLFWGTVRRGPNLLGSVEEMRRRARHRRGWSGISFPCAAVASEAVCHSGSGGCGMGVPFNKQASKQSGISNSSTTLLIPVGNS